jgi:hypothetical protein
VDKKLFSAYALFLKDPKKNDEEVKKFTSDAKRFKDIESYQEWLKKGRQIYSLGQQYSEEFKEWMVPLTANRPTSRGLRQNKWLR